MINQSKIRDFIETQKKLLSKLPSNDKLVVSIVLDIINNNLANDIYREIPKELVEVIEQKDFSKSLYIAKQTLLTYGIPEDIVENLSLVDIKKILKSLELFISDTSTVKFIKDIVLLLEENLYVAELFLVYDPDADDIYLTPNWFIEPSDEVREKYQQIDYDEAYNGIPELLISKEDFLEQFRNKNAVTPYKTNILLITSDNINSASLLYEIISQILYNYLRSRYVSLYLEESFNVQFEDIIKIYYYIVALFKDLDVLTANMPNTIDLIYSSENTTFNYDDIEQILTKHDHIHDYDSYHSFMSYLKEHYPILTKSQVETFEFSDLQAELYSKYPELITYLNSVYNNSTDKKYDLYNLVLRLRKSVKVSCYDIPYINIFIETYLFLEQIPLDDRISYQFIQYYKPVNVLILDLVLDYIILTINDKLNNVYIKSLLTEIDIDSLYVDKFWLVRYLVFVFLSLFTAERYEIFDISFVLSIVSVISDELDIDDFINSISLDIKCISFEELTRFIISFAFFLTQKYRLNVRNIYNIESDITKSENIDMKEDIYKILESIAVDSCESIYKKTVNQIVIREPRFYINDIVEVHII